MKIGLFFGSFNPIHTGHLIIASFIANVTDLKQVWLIVSPQNPLKESNLLNQYHRLHLVQLAVEDDKFLRASNMEFNLPKPSYTIDTLKYLEERFPNHEFQIILGSDSYENLPKWKNFDLLIKNYSFLVYVRRGFETRRKWNENTIFLTAPLMEISSSLIRNLIRQKKSIKYLVPDKVCEEIERSGYYKLTS